MNSYGVWSSRRGTPKSYANAHNASYAFATSPSGRICAAVAGSRNGFTYRAEIATFGETRGSYVRSGSFGNFTTRCRNRSNASKNRTTIRGNRCRRRATFAANLFAAGGIKAVSDDGHDDADSAAAAFKASGATIACICSSDDVYAELAEATAAALKAAGAQRVYLAGKGDYPGVDEYVYLGANALDILTRVEA